MKILFRFNHSGFSLVELVVSSGLAIVFLMIAAGGFVEITQGMNIRRLSMIRDTTALMVRSHISNMKTIRTSMKDPSNKDFYDCVCNSGVACKNMQKSNLVIFDSPGTPSPAYFNNTGFACNPTSQNCLLKVDYTVAAQCPPNPPLPNPSPLPALTCTVPAEVVVVEYNIQKNPLITDNAINLKPINGKVYFLASEINPPGSGVCP